MGRRSTAGFLCLVLLACGKSTQSPAASSTLPTTDPSSPSASTGAPTSTPTSMSTATAAPATPGACIASREVAGVWMEAALSGGFGARVETLILEGNRALVLVPTTGGLAQPMGLFEACLKDDEVRAFEPLVRAAAAANEPLLRDTGMVVVRWREGSRSVDARIGMPASSPAGGALFREVGRWLAAARAHAVQAVRLELVAPSSLVAGRPAPYKVRLVNAGTAALTVTLPDEGPWLETTDLPMDNPMWEPTGDKLPRMPKTPLPPGASIDLPLAVKHPAKKRVAVLARFEGRIELGGVAHLDAPFVTRLTSNIVEVDVRAP